jgi:SNF2 family DNA or RNA helicase
MRIEAHIAKTTNRLEVRMLRTQRDRAEKMRKAVTASRYGGSFDGGMSFRFYYPLSVEKCQEMRDAWGADLKVHAALADWYRTAHKARVQHVALAAQTDAELPVVAARYPKLNAWLKGDQRVTAAWIANAYRGGGLLADEVGTGKTAGVVAGLVEAGITGPTLIVCPKISVRAVWLRELKQHTDLPVYACSGTRAKREKELAAYLEDPSPFKVLIIVAEMLRIKAHRAKGRVEEFFGYGYPELFEVDWTAVVVDESHKLLGAMDVVRANLAGEGLRALSYAPNRLKLAVSATPFGKGGRVQALFGTLHWLWPDEFSSRWAWLGKYFEVNDQKVFVKGGRGATETVKRVGELLHEKQMWADLGPRVLRRTMEEVSPAHRGLKNWIEVLCELESQQSNQYKQFARDAELAVDGGIISTVGVLDFITRCRQFANGTLRKEGGRVVYTGHSAKIDQLLAHLDQIAPTRKVVVASQYNEFLDVVERRLNEEGYNTLRIDGKSTDHQREGAMRLFQEGAPYKHYQVMLLNTQAGGVSITLDAAEELHALDESDPNTMTQLFGRIFRRGRAHEVFFYTYRAIGTIDEELGFNVQSRQEKQARLLDGRRGLEYARELAQYKKEA